MMERVPVVGAGVDRVDGPRKVTGAAPYPNDVDFPNLAHVILAALAARAVSRPVRLVLTRPQMFTGIGHRPTTVQHLTLGATRTGELVAIDHQATSATAMEDDNLEPTAAGSAAAYACPNLATRDQQRRLNIPVPWVMRAPGDAEGNFALESALDELSYALGVDPLELRLRNDAETHPQSGLPWSSKALRDCYQQGADRFGWSARNPEVGSMREGGWLVGYGMAGVSYYWWQVPCQARASLGGDGNAFVRSAATDTGTGTYTVMTQLSAELLGLRLDQVRFDLGDTNMPYAPRAGGSGLTAALGNAVHAACRRLIQAFLDQVADDPDSPLRGCRLDEVAVADGRIHRTNHPEQGEAYTEILARHRLDELTADGDSAPPRPQDVGLAPPGRSPPSSWRCASTPTLAWYGSRGWCRPSMAAASSTRSWPAARSSAPRSAASAWPCWSRPSPTPAAAASPTPPWATT